jgi:hypothetical protein
MWNPFRRKGAEPAPPSRAAPLPPAEAGPDRYEGRPLLILLENYVLAAIGELPPEKAAAAGAVVRKTWGGDDDWMRTLRGEVDLNDSVDDTLRQLWARNRQIARENGVELSPEQFAMMVCDQNFAHLFTDEDQS